jgi:hypothetical protein
MSDSIAENITALLSKRRRRRKKLIIETKGVYIYVCMCVCMREELLANFAEKDHRLAQQLRVATVSRHPYL